MPAHGIGEGGFKEIVIAGGEHLDGQSQIVALVILKLVDGAHVKLGQKHGFKRPESPERYQAYPVLGFKDYALLLYKLIL